MPEVRSRWPSGPLALLELGRLRVRAFCLLNNLTVPPVRVVSRADWMFEPCAYYRPDEGWYKEHNHEGINICLEKCGRPCTPAESRNWTWPGNVTDREPYGVVAHELGHHCDYLLSERKSTYYGDFSIGLCKSSGEPPITSYAPNEAEWFAEMFRLFITNHGLLKCIRPRTYALLSEKFRPVGTGDWRRVLGVDVPDRILRSLKNKGAK